jgi:hypothetical protein
MPVTDNGGPRTVQSSVGEMMSLLNSSLCIFANSMSDTIDDTEEVNNATYPVHS